MEAYLRGLIDRSDCEYLEVHIEDREYNFVSYSGKELENAGSARSYAGNVRVYSGGVWSFVCFNGGDIEKYLERALSNIVHMGARVVNGVKGLSVGDCVVASYRTDCKEFPLEIPLSYKVELMGKYNDIILSQRDIQTSRVVYKDLFKRGYYANSEGSYIDSEQTFTGFALYGMAKDGMNVQRGYFTDAGYCGFEVVRDRESECYELSKNASDLLGADSIVKGSYNVLLDPRMAGVFAHEAFGHLSESDFLQENEDMQKVMLLGRRFGFRGLNIVDDATMEGLAGYLPYDDEGVLGKRKYLIKDGVLHSRLNSRESAFQLGEVLSGNARSLSPLYSPIVRMTNTFIDRGDRSFSELVEMLDDGIYCVDYLGGMTNLESFTFTAARSYEVKGGKVKRLLKDVVLTGNVFETLGNIRAIGDDLGHFGGLGGCGKGGQNGLPVTVGGPHILVDNVVIGGR